MQRVLLSLVLLCMSHASFGQVLIQGYVLSEDSIPIQDANIKLNDGRGTSTNASGYFQIFVDSAELPVELGFSHINYIPSTFIIDKDYSGQPINIFLISRENILDEVSITDRLSSEDISVMRLSPRSFESLPSPDQDIARLLVSLPGVVGNNELSSSYSVRGGNFDENLVFVEGIPIYKPQVVTNGQQEGLGFVNISMTENVKFSSGGWSSETGDRLSSVLQVSYREPQEFEAEAVLGLLGGSLSVGDKIGKTSFIAGVRHKNTRYILNTLDTEGEYLPRFTDFQFFSTTTLNETTELSVLGGYAFNDYEIIPTTRETEFGTFNRSLRLTIGFDGLDRLQYRTFQAGMKVQKKWNENHRSTLILSAVRSLETEYTELEGGYRLCDVNRDISSDEFNQCAVIRGLGTLYEHRRNYLQSNLYTAEWKNQIHLNSSSSIDFGIGWNLQDYDDRLAEFDFVDSANFVTEISSANAENDFERQQFTGHTQIAKNFSNTTLSAGLRYIYRTFTNEFTISPRVQLLINPDNTNKTTWKLAAGVYRQIPVFREFRDFDGRVNENLDMQSSVHLIAGLEKSLRFWGRPFKLITEGYYKYLWDVNTYQVDNVRIRYLANNNATAFAYGADFRLSGEFIPDTESWFSLSLLSTKENLQGDGLGYVRRPMDQRFTMNIFFQDHIPGNPSFRVNVHVQLGTGLPFGPPENLQLRQVFNGDSYRRVDLGFSKVFDPDSFERFIISAEILNLTGSRNANSYTWVEDVFDQQFAVPNTLSARFLNLKLAITL